MEERTRRTRRSPAPPPAPPLTCRSVMETLCDSTVGRRGRRGEVWGEVTGEYGSEG